jgi:competence protein ComEA
MEKWEKYRWVLLLASVFVAVLGLVLLQLLRREPAPIILSTATSPPLPEVTPTPRPLRVYVSGAVLHADVYTLDPDSITKDALLAAGGPAKDADLDRINLASALVDGQHIYVPHLGEEDPPVQLPSRFSGIAEKVNVNVADATVLETLPGVGPVLAQRIVAYRQEHGRFARIDDILEVSGIGQQTFEALRDLITTQ